MNYVERYNAPAPGQLWKRFDWAERSFTYHLVLFMDEEGYVHTIHFDDRPEFADLSGGKGKIYRRALAIHHHLIDDPDPT